MVKNDSMSSFWCNRKVVITGHTGFKGSWLLLQLLELGAEVWGYSLDCETDEVLFNKLYLTNKKKNPNYNFVHRIGDINDISSFSKFINEASPDIIFHLAAQPLVRESYLDPLKTWNTNVLGTLNLLESVKGLNKCIAMVLITTDKVYQNKEWIYAYREEDRLGGHDPYSASKAAMELAVDSWRKSFCGNKSHQTSCLSIATARAGNVVGGGDWSKDRLVPDCVKALHINAPIKIRNPSAKRPWQHVLEPLHGYITLAKALYEFQLKSDSYENNPYSTSFNFGSGPESNKTVKSFVDEILELWPGECFHINSSENLHEANKLSLSSEKAFHMLNWSPVWNFHQTIRNTIEWYQKFYDGNSALSCCLKDIEEYQIYLEKYYA